MSQSFIAFSGWIMSAASPIFAAFVYLKQRSLKRLHLIQNNSTAMNFPSGDNDFRVRMGDKDVGRKLTRVEMSLRNKGHSAIERSDLRSLVELQCDIKGGEIIHSYIEQSKTAESNTTLSLNVLDKTVRLNWELLDAKERIDIVIYPSGEYNGVKLKGHFRSGISTHAFNKEDTSRPAAILAAVAIFLELNLGSILVWKGLIYIQPPGPDNPTHSLASMALITLSAPIVHVVLLSLLILVWQFIFVKLPMYISRLQN